MDKTLLTYSEICTIINTAKFSNIHKLSFNGDKLYMEFFDQSFPQPMWTPESEPSSEVQVSPTQDPRVEAQSTSTKDELSDEALGALLVEDPEEFENQIALKEFA